MNTFFSIFITVLLAELGDKTQIATMLFAANNPQAKWIVFGAAALALISSTALGVLFGGVLTQLIDEKTIKTLGGIGFILVGLWTLVSK